MTTTINYGRLCNQIIRSLAVSLVAEKHNLAVNYFNGETINKLGFKLFSGTNIYSNTIEINDNNYFIVYNYENVYFNLNPNNHFFQTKEITNFIYNYLHSDQMKTNIMRVNPFNFRYNTNNDLCVHIRLTDTVKYNPGIAYYLNTIQPINFDNLYIATDDKTHEFISTILLKYPNATILDYDEIHTIQFASTCKHIVLSHGSFSAVIGYLSFFSNVYYPEYESDKIWYGDMFSIDNWIKCSVKQ
jgi:hypothetical protein